MAGVSTYLNFRGSCEQAFGLYKQAFGGEFTGLQRFGDMPPQSGQPPLPPEVARQVLHMALPILAGHVLMGSDSPEMFGHRFAVGNTMHINLEPDTRAEADRLFKILSEGGEVETPLQEMFWGAYYGVFSDRFGTHWMINCMAK